ncbi:phosphatidyl-myo-inositol alpha-mannosyltransferase [Fulvimarina pelagi HTCC2506]|uniref:Phosphatidyl-myo-inositol alpha-mannosyltransferase n=1 Tax=Fulvimarina pelagi HTCC2506 TaxID=314231 RepID=Q0G2N9_9HYPH|nr:glycosyltransferase family 4 protein [Fulvimarina pelagi]EAU42142.1 phosphatidyl-myo-inositol alpha-mannosyltransferase [Fulvimarina pelagi HTCC2506]
MSIQRTALIAWDYPPSASGLAVAAREIAESLTETGIDVTVYTLDRTGRAEENGVTIVGALPAKPGLSGWMRRRMAFGHLVAPKWFDRAVAADHATHRFDCLEATNWYAPGALVLRQPNTTFVTRHSTPAASTGALNGPLRDRIDGRFACRLEARSARQSHGHIFNTAAHGEKIRALYDLDPRTPTRVIGLSLPPERLARAAGTAYPHPASTKGRPVEILFVGRAEERKGFDCLLDAIKILSREASTGSLPDFRLRLVGVDAEQLAELALDVRRHLKALGRLSDIELDEAYRRADLVAAPSRYESFGLVYQEALAFGRPVIGLAVDPSARQVIGESHAGLLASEASGTALADVLRSAISSPALRLECHHRALAAAGCFSRRSLSEKTLRLYAAAREYRLLQGR